MSSRSSVIHKDVPYYPDESRKTATLYDVQDVRQEGKVPMYVMSISAANQEHDFNYIPTRDGAARDLAGAIRDLHQCEARDIILYQQRSDGDFDRVSFRDMGRNGASAADEERQAKDPKFKPGPAGDEPDWSEFQRDVYTREDVEKRIGGKLYAPVEPYRAKERTFEDDAPGASMPAGFRPPEEAQAAEPAQAAAATPEAPQVAPDGAEPASGAAAATKNDVREQESTAAPGGAAQPTQREEPIQQQQRSNEQTQQMDQHQKKKSYSPSF